MRSILDEWDAALASIGGCGDSGCAVHRPGGMHTNGGCRCAEDRMKARRVMRIDSYFRARLRETLREEDEG